MSALTAFGAKAHARSNYSNIRYDSEIARKTLYNAISYAGYEVFVAKRGSDICGMLIGSIDQLPFSRRKSATDLIFAAEAGGDQLLEAFLAWAKSKRVARVDMGVSQDDNRAMDVMYRRKGMVRTGGMYMMNVEVSQ